jgi:thiol-disulfide isomerase/thioredoxin
MNKGPYSCNQSCYTQYSQTAMPTRRILSLFLAITSVVAQHLAEIPADALKQGDQAPPLEFEFIVQGPQLGEINWANLRGMVVILDFWGTWCAPCVKRIPDLNKMVAQYRNKPVKFIAVGHENPHKVAWFLKNHPIAAWVVLDTDLSVYKSYTAWGIPYAVVIDQRGKVAAVLNPSDLTNAVIDAVLAGKAPAYPPLPPDAYFDAKTAAEYFLKVGQEEPPAN